MCERLLEADVTWLLCRSTDPASLRVRAKAENVQIHQGESLSPSTASAAVLFIRPGNKEEFTAESQWEQSSGSMLSRHTF